MAYKTISIDTDAPVKEGKATAVVLSPGHLIERTSTDGQVQMHSTAGGKAAKHFAVEDENQGKEIGDNYAVEARIFFKTFRPGDIVQARIKDGENIAIGDWLVSGAAGVLAEALADSSGTVAEQFIVGQALSACDMSASSAAGGDPANTCLVEIY